jgi:NAD(P)-dependent dehydrogenase (short-subunit alcohol dehydrogenase family)
MQSSQLKHGVSIVADLTNTADLPRAIHETVEKLGGLDILVNKCEQDARCAFLHRTVLDQLVQ